MKDPIIRTFNNGSDDFNKLSIAAKMMRAYSESGYLYYVGNTYFDYGLEWVWTTILCEDEESGLSWQALSPRDQEEILQSHTPKELGEAVEHIFADMRMDSMRELY